MKKNLLSILLVSSIIISAASCSQNNTAETSASAAPADTAQTSSTAAETEKEKVSTTAYPVPVIKEETHVPSETTPTGGDCDYNITSAYYPAETTAAETTAAAAETAAAATTVTGAHKPAETGLHAEADAPAAEKEYARDEEIFGIYDYYDDCADGYYFDEEESIASADCIIDYGDDDCCYPEIQAQAGTLTGGEYNDNRNFDEWKELCGQNSDWTDISKEWNIDTLSRTLVKVKNGDTPVFGATVKYWNDSALLWQSVTDSRGNAYVFDSISAKSSLRGNKVTVEVNGKTAATVKVNKNGGEIDVSIDEKTAPKRTLDLMFMIDTTGSMSDELRYIQAELKDVIKRVTTDNQISVNLSVNFYRDEGDDYVVRDFPFTSDIDKAVSDLSKQYSVGGGDYPEAVADALENAVLDHNWSDDSEKLMFLVLDAPPHTYDKDRLIPVIEAAAKAGIRIIPIASSGVDTTTEFLLRSFAIATGGTYTFLTNDSGIGGDHLEPTVSDYKVEKLNDMLVRIIGEYFSSDDKPASAENGSTRDSAVKYPVEYTQNSAYFDDDSLYCTSCIRSIEDLYDFYEKYGIDYRENNFVTNYMNNVDFRKEYAAAEVVMLGSGSIHIDKTKDVYAFVDSDNTVKFSYSLTSPEIGTCDMSAIWLFTTIPYSKEVIEMVDVMEIVDNEIDALMKALEGKTLEEKRDTVSAVLSTLEEDGYIRKGTITFDGDMFSFEYGKGGKGGIKLTDFNPLMN